MEYRGITKTYTRQHASHRPIEATELPRKRIRMDRDGTAIEETNFSGASGQNSTLTPVSAGEDLPTSSTAPSSPQPDPLLFSDDAIHQIRPATPPSSPPAPLPSPVPLKRNPTFSSLKRKRSVHDELLSDPSKEPLREISDNAAKSKQSSKKTRLSQMQIDLGGEIRRTCKTCGMEYIPSNAEDVMLHDNFHDMNVHGVALNKNLSNDKTLRKLQSTKRALKVDEDIVVVDRRSSLMSRKQVEKVLGVVNTDLSATGMENGQLWSSLKIKSTIPKTTKTKKRKGRKAAPEPGSDRFKAFMYLMDGKCVAFCLAEKISTASQVLNCNPQEIEHQNLVPSPKSSSITTSADADVVVLGISRIWCSRKYRKQGLATDLLDCARVGFFYGMEIPKNLVAFSQPTESGIQLAERWFGLKAGWHVYTEAQAQQGNL